MITLDVAKILFDKSETAYRITLNDPPLNILDIAMLEELREALAKVRPDRALLVMSAAGEKAFSAGASVQDHVGDKVETMLAVFHECFRILNRLELVSVALVRGAALGGGCELALACDLILASEKAKFGQPEISLGVFPPVAAYQLSHQIAPRRGLEMLLTGDPIDAEASLQMGLVNAVFSAGDFERKAEEWLGRITRHSASSLRLAKRAFKLAAGEDFPSKLHMVERLYLDELMSTEDATEGLSAFLEKRHAAWRGR